MRWGVICGGAESGNGVEAFGWQAVDADAVQLGVDDAVGAVEQLEQAGFVCDDLEYGFLDADAVAFAESGDAAEAPLAFGVGGVDVIGEDEIHQRGVQGM